MYLGVFLKGMKIDAQKLMRLWIVEGFVEVKDDIILEEFAEQYFKQLGERCLVQVVG